jgi:hypothetical protein
LDNNGTQKSGAGGGDSFVRSFGGKKEGRAQTLWKIGEKNPTIVVGVLSPSAFSIASAYIKIKIIFVQISCSKQHVTSDH